MSQHPKILIVDDEPDQLDALERTLRGAFEITRAESGADAIDLLRSGAPFAVVLSDLRMPGIGGLEVLAAVRPLLPAAVRAASSGAIDVQGMADAINTGSIDRFVLKPWTPDYLRIQMLESIRAHEFNKERLILERLAATDPLTELANRRHFDHRLRVELERAARHGRPLAVAAVDVDGFKAINDKLGHAFGDDALKRVAEAASSQVRSLDFVARVGGDEFMIIMPDTPETPAALVGERVRVAIESSARGTLGAVITVSVGVAAFPEAGQSVEALLQAADEALYRAKSQGRNQTAVASKRPLIT